MDENIVWLKVNAQNGQSRLVRLDQVVEILQVSQRMSVRLIGESIFHEIHDSAKESILEFQSVASALGLGYSA